MAKTATASYQRHFEKVLGGLLVTASLAFLAGCQGFSTGSSSQQKQQQTSSLSLNTTTLAFTSVSAGSSETLPLVAQNVGSTDITINSVAISAQSFSLLSPTLPLTIPAGQSTQLTVQFAPNTSGTFSATMSVASDASNSVPSVTLTGTGTGTTTTAGQLTPSQTSESFGSVTVGSQQSQNISITNTGGSNVDISQASVTGAGFQLSGITVPLTLTPAQSTTLTVTFAPQTAASVTGTLTIASDASNSSLAIPLSGNGISPGDLSPSPSSLSFNGVTVGSNRQLSETITNTGESSVTISQVSISGTGFSLSGLTAPTTLTAGSTVTFDVTFTPTTAGTASGTVTITSTASNPSLTIPISGTGTAASGTLTASPATLAIGSVVVGTSSTGSGSLAASGSSVTVTAASSNNPAFTISGLSLPVTIAAGNSVSYTVVFAPSSTGSTSATLTFTSNAQPTSITQTVTGTGTAAPTYSVSLNWDASTSSNISGYNMYRAVYTTACGTFSKINSALITTLSYTDSVVVDGTNYCYATTAVNSSNEESAYSNIVPDVQIPAP